MAGFPLSGIDANDPTPGILREIRFAQGASFGSGTSRDVCLLGNKTSAGTETVETLGSAIVDESDCIDRFGNGSEIHMMYRAFNKIPQQATVYAIAVTVGTGAGTIPVVLATNATANTTLKITVIGETIEVGVLSGDTPTTAGDNVVNKVNQQLHWPVTAGNSTGTVTFTSKMAGTRHDYNLNMLRASFTKSAGMTATKGSLTAGSTDDDQTTAIALLEAANMYYQVNSKTTTSAPTSTDNGLGEHSTSIKTQVLPVNGKACIGIAGLTGTQTQATTVASDGDMNSPVYFLVHAENNDWPASMLAAHYCGIKRSKEIGYAAANLSGYGLNGELCLFPDPFAKSDRPTSTEIRADLNNGVTPISFTNNGSPYIVRDVTSRSWQGASSTNDYRAREGHIPSVMFKAWDVIGTAYRTTAQDNVDNDPAEGQKPLVNVTYPRDVKSLVGRCIDILINDDAGPLLAPSQSQLMKDSTAVVKITGGISAHVRLVAVEHNLKGQFLLDESGPSY